MNDSNDNEPQENLELFSVYDPFFDIYIESLGVLSDLGIDFDFKQRIPIFKVYTHLCEIDQTDQVIYAKQLLDLLRDLMSRGLEPEHNGDTYV